MAGIEARIVTNADEVARHLSRLAEGQIPFATAKALTHTANDARVAVRASLSKKFKLRNKWTEGGIRSTKALKKDWPVCQAGVGILTNRAYLADHEKGTVRRGARGHRKAIPTRLVGRTKGGRIRKGMRPRDLRQPRQRGKSGRLTSKGGGFVPKGGARIVKPKGRGKRARLLTYYLLRQRVRIKPVLGMTETVGMAAESVYRMHFSREWAKAIKDREAFLARGGRGRG